MSDPEYVAIEAAGRLTGVPARTLRRWAEAGKVPVVAGQRKRLVRLEDVRRLAAMTGHQPDTTDVTGAYAGQATGHMAESVADNNMPPAGALAPTPQAYLEEIRDDWLQPLIDQLKEAERTIGRLEAERDALRAELTVAQGTGQDASQGAHREPTAHERREAFWHAPAEASEGLVARLRRLVGRGK
jgi:DNA-binding transcriptional MerR regulator